MNETARICVKCKVLVNNYFMIGTVCHWCKRKESV